MQPYERESLWDAICAAGNLQERFLCGAEKVVRLAELERCTSLMGRAESLRGRSVLLRTRDQLASALAMIELDGIVRRMVPVSYTHLFDFVVLANHFTAEHIRSPAHSKVSGSGIKRADKLL